MQLALFLKRYNTGADAATVSYVAEELNALTPQSSAAELEVASEHTARLLPAFAALPASHRLAEVRAVLHEDTQCPSAGTQERLKPQPRQPGGATEAAAAQAHQSVHLFDALDTDAREAPVVSSRNAARQVAAAPMDDGRAAELDTLAALCPFDVAADREYLAHVLSVHGLEAAAQWLLDTDLQASKASWRARREEARARSAAEQEREAAARKQTVAKFLLQPAASPATGARHSSREGRALEPHAPAEPDRLPAKTVRYRDGCITSTRRGWGEKYVVVEKHEEWNGGSVGRVKSKGKRGKGFV